MFVVLYQIIIKGLSSLYNQNITPIQRAVTILGCLLVLCVAALVLFGVLNFEFIGRAETAVGVEPQSTWSVSFITDKLNLFSDTGAHVKASLVVAVIFSVVIAFLRPLGAIVTLFFSCILVALIYQVVPHTDVSPSVWGFIVVMLVVIVCYFVCERVQRRLHQLKINQVFKNYVPSNLTDYYRQHPEGMDAISESRQLTILFCDIKRFTGIAETLEPDRLRDWLNAYFGVVSEVISQHRGTVDKYMGDSVMAFWGAPWSSDTHAVDALFASRDIQQRVDALSSEMESKGLPAIRIGIGVATGFANVGHMGSRHHMAYTAVGDPVNTANRLQRCTGYYDLPIVVSASTVEDAPEFLFRELDTVHVKGRRRFVRLFEPVCLVDEASQALLKRLQLHRKAMQFYRSGHWIDAQHLFSKLGRDEPREELFYQRYVDRLQQIQSTRPGDESAHIVDLTRQVG